MVCESFQSRSENKTTTSSKIKSERWSHDAYQFSALKIDLTAEAIILHWPTFLFSTEFEFWIIQRWLYVDAYQIFVLMNHGKS